MNLMVLFPVLLEILHSIPHPHTSLPSSTHHSPSNLLTNQIAPSSSSPPSSSSTPANQPITSPLIQPPPSLASATLDLLELLPSDDYYADDEDSNQEYEPTSEEIETERRQKIIKQTALQLWDSFRLNNMSANSSNITSTVASAMSTLWVMGAQEEFYRARHWIDTHAQWSKDQDNDIVESLLSCYALSGDRMCLKKAQDWMDMMLKDSSITEANRLEARYLSDLTGDQNYWNEITKSQKQISSSDKSQNTLLDLKDQLLIKVKSFIQSNRKDKKSLNHFKESIDNLDRKKSMVKSGNQVCVRSEALHFSYCKSTSVYLDGMGARDCDLGALFGLGAHALMNSLPRSKRKSTMDNAQKDLDRIAWYWQLAEQLTETCHLMANKSKNGFPPKVFQFKDSNAELVQNEQSGINAHALAESYFILWRLTHQIKYREYAWELAQALNKTSTLNTSDPNLLGSTLKYLYLIYSPEHLLPLDHWTFGTHGQPLPICGQHNRAYPVEKCNGFS